MLSYQKIIRDNFKIFLHVICKCRAFIHSSNRSSAKVGSNTLKVGDESLKADLYQIHNNFLRIISRWKICRDQFRFIDHSHFSTFLVTIILFQIIRDCLQKSTATVVVRSPKNNVFKVLEFITTCMNLNGQFI